MNTISFAMGARGDFLSQFFWGTDLDPVYKSDGHADYKKCHRVGNISHDAAGTHLFIDYDINDNEMITFFMWDKVVSTSAWKKTHNNDLLDQFTKIYFTMLESWQENNKFRKCSYDRVINFQDIFNIDIMSQHYLAVTGNAVDQARLDFLHNTNCIQQEKFNSTTNKNTVKLAHMLFKFEILNNLTQEQRKWSIVDLIVSNSTVDDKLEKLASLLNFSNYKMK